MKRCVVIGPMPINFDLKKMISEDDFVFCADGGYLQAEKLGIEPNVIIGDFDSSNKPENTKAFVITLPVEKDDTDSHYIAKQIVNNGYTDALLCGVTGGRIEHTFAMLQTLKFLAENNVNATIVDENSQLIVIKDGNITIPNMENKYFSVFSLDTVCYKVSVTGGKYNAADVDLFNNFPIGVSNEFIGNPVKISVEKGTLLIIITNKDKQL